MAIKENLKLVKNWGKLLAATINPTPIKNTEAICIFDRNDLQFELLARVADLWEVAGRPHVIINGRLKYEATETSYGYKQWHDILSKNHKIPIDYICAIKPAHHSGEEAEKFVAMCHEKGWKTVTVMAPPYYLPRCFLHTLGVTKKLDINLCICCATISHIEWDRYIEKHAVKGGVVVRGMRFDHLDDELERIIKYSALYQEGVPGISPTSSIEEGVLYLQNLICGV